MLVFKLAIRNLIGAGIRTWLNVIVTSMSFFMIIFLSGMYDGMILFTRRVTVDTEIGGGQYWHPRYDPDDPFTLDDAHGAIPPEFQTRIHEGAAMPVLVMQGAVYPEGRMVPAIIRGIPPDQQIVSLPTAVLDIDADGALPALIGAGMAELIGLSEGDVFTLRWRDVYGSYDAEEARVVGIMEVENFKVDLGQVWLPLETVRRMSGMAGEATYLTIGPDEVLTPTQSEWVLRDHDFLLSDIIAAVEADQPYARVMYGLLLALASMGIFNSQVLSIFRRRREIGTLMALGVPRGRVVGLFTIEGALVSLLALILTTLYGLPVLYLVATKGIPIPYEATDIGIVMGKRMYPYYSGGLLIGTALLVSAVVGIVSYLPSRRIAKMKPTEALRGRFT